VQEEDDEDPTTDVYPKGQEVQLVDLEDEE